MFGLALRSYRRRLNRLATSHSERDRSLWEAMLSHLSQGKLVTRSEVLHRFRYDEEVLVRGVLHDLCESGLVFKLGSGKDTAYRGATTEELEQLGAKGEGPEELVWVMVYREGPVTIAELSRLTSLSETLLNQCLENLAESDRVELTADGRYRSRAVVMSPDSTHGWEAAIFDHFQAMVKTLGARLTLGASPDRGGSTYSFNIWPGHPMEKEVRSALGEFREKYTDLRRRVQAHNTQHGLPVQYEKSTIYCGQSSIEHDRDDIEEADDADI
jgi:hypothetical protein